MRPDLQKILKAIFVGVSFAQRVCHQPGSLHRFVERAECPPDDIGCEASSYVELGAGERLPS
jgi:hypothetical protein